MSERTRPKAILRTYPNWFYIPAALVFGIFFIVPTIMAFYFSLTRWTLFNATYIGFDNYERFLSDPMLLAGLRNTMIYAVLTSGFKVIIALPLAVLLTSAIRLKTLFRGLIFFPVLVSTVAVGITFAALMQPSIGLINTALGYVGLPQPDWLGNPRLALYSVIACGCLEGHRHRHGDLHRRHPFDPYRVLRCGETGGRRLGEVSPCDCSDGAQCDLYGDSALLYWRVAYL